MTRVGGLASLRRWWLERGDSRPIDVFLSEETADIICARYRCLEPCRLRATVLGLDGAMWRRRLFSHLTIDEALPTACSWSVDSIVLTQIGRSAPPHEELPHLVAGLCPKARAAYDGLVLSI